MSNPEELQRIEHQERMFRAMLEENLRKQRDLKNQEGKLRTQLVESENRRFGLLKSNLGALGLILLGLVLSSCKSPTPFVRLAELPCNADSCGKRP